MTFPACQDRNPARVRRIYSASAQVAAAVLHSDDIRTSASRSTRMPKVDPHPVRVVVEKDGQIVDSATARKCGTIPRRWARGTWGKDW